MHLLVLLLGLLWRMTYQKAEIIPAYESTLNAKKHTRIIAD